MEEGSLETNADTAENDVSTGDLSQPALESEPFLSTAVVEGEDAPMQPHVPLSGSFASFKEDVYSPTTVTTQPHKTGCKESCGSCLKACCTKCYRRVKPLMWKYRVEPTAEDSRASRLAYALMCPPHGRLSQTLLLMLVVLLGFGLIISALKSDGLPGGTFFGLYVLFLVCILAGKLVSLIRLPPLLGMLIIGVILGNVPYINVARHISPDWSAAIRKVALAVILTRAGLGLDPKALKRMSCVVMRLAFTPCLVEALTCMVASHFILGMDWIWGLMLGFVLAAVSPAVVVPCLLSLSERGYGLNKGIPTLVIAAASIDDVLAISAFSICMGIAFSASGVTGAGDLTLTILRGPLEALAGIVYGIVAGLILWYLPDSKSDGLHMKRSCLVLAGGLFALFGSAAAGIDGAGALGCLTLPFVAALRWRQGDEKIPTETHMGHLWTVFQPLLFGLIGAAVNLSEVDGFFQIVGYGLAVLVIGLVLRLIASFLVVFGTDFNLKERLFIPLAWLPKATVQALLGSLPYDKAVQNGRSDEEKSMGMKILTVAVLCILVTAPIGAAAITLSGPRLLHRSNVQETVSHRDTDATDAGATGEKDEEDSV